jgi:hypothetical protein
VKAEDGNAVHWLRHWPSSTIVQYRTGRSINIRSRRPTGFSAIEGATAGSFSNMKLVVNFIRCGG